MSESKIDYEKIQEALVEIQSSYTKHALYLDFFQNELESRGFTKKEAKDIIAESNFLVEPELIEVNLQTFFNYLQKFCDSLYNAKKSLQKIDKLNNSIINSFLARNLIFIILEEEDLKLSGDAHESHAKNLLETQFDVYKFLTSKGLSEDEYYKYFFPNLSIIVFNGAKQKFKEEYFALLNNYCRIAIYVYELYVKSRKNKKLFEKFLTINPLSILLTENGVQEFIDEGDIDEDGDLV